MSVFEVSRSGTHPLASPASIMSCPPSSGAAPKAPVAHRSSSTRYVASSMVRARLDSRRQPAARGVAPQSLGTQRRCALTLRAQGQGQSRIGMQKEWIGPLGGGQAKPKQPKVDLGFKRNLKERIAFPEGNNQLGLGSYGVVKRVIDKSTGLEYAMKSVPKTPRSAKEAKDMDRYLGKIVNEVKVMEHIGPSLNVVYLYDVFEDDTHVHLLLELCEGGELWKRIRQGQYSEAEAAGMIRSVVRVVAQCHAKHVIHRDIKPDNFLFMTDGDDAVLKATDFGLATYFEPGEVLKRRCGTPSYLAPEVVKRNYGPEADCWSAGVTAYQLLSGQLPFVDTVNERPQVKEVLRAVVEDPVDLDNTFWRTKISPGARDLVAGLLDRDPKKRLTAREALKHPWLEEGGEASRRPLETSIVQRLQRFGTFAPLKRAVLQSIATRWLQTDARLLQEAELRQIYERFDTQAEGTLELAELQAGLTDAGYDISLAETMQLVTGMDLDGNGRIEYEEFVTALIDWGNLPLQQDRFKEEVRLVFEDMDRDSNGLIDREEMAAVVCNCHDSDEVCKAIVDRCMAMADLDGNGLIDWDEFYSLLQTDEADDLTQYEARLRSSDANRALEDS